MIYRDIPFTFDLTTADGRRMGEGRSPGIHLSDVIKYMRLTIAKEKIRETGSDNWAMLGFAFENVVEDALVRYFGKAKGREVVSQSECCVDGIFITPDGYDLSDGSYEEYKATWRSLKKLDDFHKWFWHWEVQLKGNCYAAGTNKARLVMFFVMGDYSFRPPEGGPQLRCREYEFTDEELEENWEMVKRVRDEMVEQGWTREAAA